MANVIGKVKENLSTAAWVFYFIMIFSLAGSLDLPGIPSIPSIEYSMAAMAARIVSWLTEKTRDMLGACVLRGDLIIPDGRKR